MKRADVERWLDSYVEAWRTYDPAQIGALFSEDIEYRFHPYDQPVVGRDAVVEAWLGEGEHEGASERDEPDTYDARYAPLAIDGDLAVATGSTTYLTEPGGGVEKIYDNCFVIHFDADGRCREFTEWYMQRPGA